MRVQESHKLVLLKSYLTLLLCLLIHANSSINIFLTRCPKRKKNSMQKYMKNLKIKKVFLYVYFNTFYKAIDGLFKID